MTAMTTGTACVATAMATATKKDGEASKTRDRFRSDLAVLLGRSSGECVSNNNEAAAEEEKQREDQNATTVPRRELSTNCCP